MIEIEKTHHGNSVDYTGYLFKEKLSQHAFSSVRRLFDPENPNNTIIAKDYDILIEEIPETLREYCYKNILNEYSLQSTLDPSYVVQAHGYISSKHVDEEIPRIRIYLEDCSKGDLSDWRRGTDDWAQILIYCSRMVEIIDWLHNTANIIHRDIKPDNFFVTSSGVLKIGDFENARRIDQIALNMEEEMSVDTRIIGSYLCRAPDLSNEFGTEGDIFSLGISLFYMFSGDLPYEFEDDLSPQELSKNIANIMGTDIMIPVDETEMLNPAQRIKWSRIITECLRPKNERADSQKLLSMINV